MPNDVVAAIAMAPVSTFELAVCCEVFAIHRPQVLEKGYEFMVCAVDDEPMPANGGITITTPYRLEDVRRADTVIVSAYKDVGLMPSPAVIEVLQDAYERGARILSVCSGAFALG